jgi:WD40 repeat protein
MTDKLHITFLCLLMNYLNSRVMRALVCFWLLGSLLLNTSAVRAQKEATIWYFGSNTGFDFSAGAPQTLANSARKAGSACVSLSDKRTGQLLFYSDAAHIWNRQHRLMPHGDSLRGFYNIAQGVLALPVPGQDQQYYLFTLDYNDNASIVSANLSYSLVDMRLADGLGDIVASQKNQLLTGEYDYQLTAVPHTNGRDYWLLTRQWGSNTFRTYLVNEQGITLKQAQSLGPERSLRPLSIPDGFLKASPDGKKVAYGTADDLPLSLFDFDAATGLLSHYINLGKLLSVGGISFSPDNSKLYVQNYSLLPDQITYKYQRNIISQFDLSAGSDAAIAASGMSIVGANSNTNIRADVQSSNGEYTLQLGPDGRLYGNSSYSDRAAPEVQGQENMYVINAPNQRGFACDVAYETFVFARGDAHTNSFSGFPTFLESYFNGLEPTPLPPQECAEGELGIFPNPTTDVFQLQVPGSCFTPYQVVLYNALGQRVYHEAITTAISSKQNISSLAPGIYFLEAQFKNKTWWGKLDKKAQ